MDTRAAEGRTLLAITENGYGKRTDIAEYLRGDEPQSRGGYGLKGYHVTDKTGPIAGAKVVTGDEDILLISDDGTIIRMATADVNVYSRTAQGVRVMRVNDDTKVISLARTEKEPAEGEEEQIPTEEE